MSSRRQSKVSSLRVPEGTFNMQQGTAQLFAKRPAGVIAHERWYAVKRLTRMYTARSTLSHARRQPGLLGSVTNRRGHPSCIPLLPPTALPVPLSAELLRSITSGPEPLCGPDVLDQLDQLAVVVLTPLLGGATSSGEGGTALSGIDSRSGHSSTTAEDAHRQLTLYESVKGLFGWLAKDSGCGGLGDVDCLREQVCACGGAGGRAGAPAAGVCLVSRGGGIHGCTHVAPCGGDLGCR